MSAYRIIFAEDGENFVEDKKSDDKDVRVVCRQANELFTNHRGSKAKVIRTDTRFVVLKLGFA